MLTLDFISIVIYTLDVVFAYEAKHSCFNILMSAGDFIPRVALVVTQEQVLYLSDHTCTLVFS